MKGRPRTTFSRLSAAMTALHSLILVAVYVRRSDKQGATRRPLDKLAGPFRRDDWRCDHSETRAYIPIARQFEELVSGFADAQAQTTTECHLQAASCYFSP